MAGYLSVPTRRGSIFQGDRSTQKLFQQKLAIKTAEYYSRHTRKSYEDDDELVILNVGGKTFKTRKTTLRNVPGTKLAHLDEHDDHYDAETQEFFFDRNPFLFQFILDYYRTGSMHIPRNVCSSAIKEELRFWELGDGSISECCRKYYFDALDELTTYELIKSEFYSLPTYTGEIDNDNLTFETRFEHYKRKAWVFIDNHESSFAAKMFAVLYYGLVVLSILSLFFSTLPSIRGPLHKHVLIRKSHDVTPQFNISSNITGTLRTLLTTDPPDFIVIIDLICLFFFTFEFGFRLYVCPCLKERFKSWYTLLDLLYIIPAWCRLIVDVSRPFYWQEHVSHITLLILLDAMMVLRVFRIFRLSRHYRGLRVLLLAIKASVSELTLLVVFVGFALTIFASFIYSAEHYSGTSTFESIFMGLWWALVTLTTVGYGDKVPDTTVGYLIACTCAITGLLIIGMVVPIIAGNFHLYYGFRYAGCEDIELSKPEFIPSESENPVPCLDYETYKPKLTKPFGRTVSPKDSVDSQRHFLRKKSSTMSELPENVLDHLESRSSIFSLQNGKPNFNHNSYGNTLTVPQIHEPNGNADGMANEEHTDEKDGYNTDDDVV